MVIGPVIVGTLSDEKAGIFFGTADQSVMQSRIARVVCHGEISSSPQQQLCHIFICGHEGCHAGIISMVYIHTSL